MKGVLKMSKASAVFLMVLAAGCVLMAMGLLGFVDTGCPRPIERFPMERLHCTVFTVGTVAGMALLAVGAAGMLAALIRDGIAAEREAKRSV